MASKEELSEQLSVTNKLAAAMERMATSAERLEKSYDTQIAAVEKLAAAFNAINTSGSVQSIEVLNKALSQASEKMKETGKTSEAAMSKMGKKVTETGKVLSEKFPKNVAIGAAALSGLYQGFKNLIALGKGVTGFFTGVIDSLVNIGASIIAIPFKMFEGLIDLAAKSGGGMNELAQEIENLRKQFGALYGPTNKAIIDTSENLKGFSDTGLSAWRVFGNLANRLKELRELATAMGPEFNKTRKEFEDNGGAVLAYQKGLGLSNDDMKSLGVVAIATGQKMSKIAKDFTKFSYALADSDDDAKLLSRDMGKMAGDVKHFGQLGAKELAEVAKYARQLGVEVDKMTGTLDQFESFDQSAESVAQLSQAFGVNLDAFKLMEAQDPASQFDMLRKAMFSAGKSADQMSRQELKLLAQQTGMDEQTAKLAFSMHNQGKSLEEIRKKSGDAEKKTMTQAQAMEKLADAIERMVMTGTGQSGGFWDMFIKGFLGGIQSSKEFQQIIWNIKRALQETYQFGVKLGQAFVKAFPGVQQFFGGLAGFFDPKKFEDLVGGSTKVLQNWMDDLKKSGGKASFPDLMKKLQEKFFNFFNQEKPEGRKILEGFKTIFKTIVKAVADGIKWASDKVADGLTFIIDMLTGKQKISGMSGAGKDSLGFLAGVVQQLGEALAHAWKVLAPKVLELLVVLGQKLVDFLKHNETVKKYLRKALPLILMEMFGPAVLRSALSFGVQAIGKSVFGMLRKALTGPAAATEAEGVAEGMGGVLSKGFGSIGKFLGPIGIAIAIGDAAVHIKDSMDKFEKTLEPEFGEAAAKVGAGATGIIDALTFGLLPDDLKGELARSIADIANKLFAAVEDYFGKTFSDKMKDYISSELDMFASLGSLIKTLFSGNDSDIADALTDFGEKFLKYIGKMFDFMVEAIPTIAVKIEQFMTHLAGRFFHVMAKVFAKGKNLPIVGGIFNALSKIFDMLGDAYDKVSTWLGKLAALFKADGVGKTLASPFVWAWEKIKAGFNAVVDFFSSTLSSIASFFSDAWDKVTSIWKAIKDWFHNHVTQPIADVFESVTSVISDVFSKAWDLVTGIWTAVKDWFNDHVIKPVSDLLSGAGGIADIIKKPFDDAWDAMSKVFSLEGVKEFWENVVKAIEDELKKLENTPVFGKMIKVAEKVFKIASPSKVFAEMGGDIVAGMNQGLETMPDVMKTNVGDSAQSAFDAVSKATKQLQTQGTGGALKAVSDMIAQVNDLNKALDTTTSIDLKTKLTKIASAIGLGGKVQYTVNPSRNVNITINMKVEINAADMEQAIVMRGTSIIRNRINWALNNPSDKASPEIPDGPVPVLPDVQKSQG